MTDPKTAEKPRYFLALDGIRLLASVNIVLFHLEGIGGLYNLQGSPAWLFRLIKGPAFHASLFFLLGGFIYATKFAAQASTFRMRPFILKRFRELYPLHLITTALMLLAVVHQSPDTTVDWGNLLFSAVMHLSLLWSFFPFFSNSFNTPSWALSAFFLCYLLFGYLLKHFGKLKKRAHILAAIVLCLAVPALWGLLYVRLGATEESYRFFHIFGPVRFFEFAIGMLLARLFALRSPGQQKPWIEALRCDLLIIFSFAAIYLNLRFLHVGKDALTWFSYHVLMTPLYAVLLYHVAIEQGIVSRLLSLKIVRQIGRSSFYPYLIHIPLISLITIVCERVFGYTRFLHDPRNIALFVIFLYGICAIYANAIKRQPRGNNREKTRNNSDFEQEKVISPISYCTSNTPELHSQ